MNRRAQILTILTITALMPPFQNCSPAFKPMTNVQQSSGSSIAPTPPVSPPSKVTVIMATGHVGRTIMSCDDGKTWINNRSDSDITRCWVTGDPNYLECDHTPTSSHGIDSGDGWFFTNYGWGYNGSVRRSRDGVNWETLRTDGWGPGLIYAAGTLFLDWSNWLLSVDQGTTWNPPTNSLEATFGHAHPVRLGDKILLFGGPTGLGLSRDQGQTWETPATFMPDWGGAAAEGNGMLVTIGVQIDATTGNRYGFSARSLDNGLTWTGNQVFMAPYPYAWTDLVFNGTNFVSWNQGQMWTSSDGLNWSSTPLPSGGPNVYWTGPVTFNAKTGTYVTIENNANYASQVAFRSADGLNWTQLDSAHFSGSHPLYQFTIGDMDSTACPP